MKPIGLFYTGGVESTLLLYNLSTQHNNLQLYTVLNPYINLDRINNTIEYVNSINNTNHKFLFLIPLKNPEKYRDRTFIRWALHLASVELSKLYIGSNEHMDHLPKRKYLVHKNIEMPFKGMQKDQVVKMYKDNNLLHLLEKTHSCFIDDVSHCKKCLGCIERFWAFERNNI